MLVFSEFVDDDGYHPTCRTGERVEFTDTPGIGSVVTVGIRTGVIDSVTSYGIPDLVRYNFTLTDGETGGFRYQVPPGEHVCMPPDVNVVVSSFTCPDCGVTWLSSRERTLTEWRPVTLT